MIWCTGYHAAHYHFFHKQQHRYVYTYIYMYKHMHMYMYAIYLYIHISLCIYIYTYLYTYVYTHLLYIHSYMQIPTYLQLCAIDNVTFSIFTDVRTPKKCFIIVHSAKCKNTCTWTFPEYSIAWSDNTRYGIEHFSITQFRCVHIT